MFLVVFAASLVCLPCVWCRMKADFLVSIINNSSNKSMNGFRLLFRKYYQHCICKRLLGTSVGDSQRAIQSPDCSVRTAFIPLSYNMHHYNQSSELEISTTTTNRQFDDLQ
jgi:hypothetical protein